MIFNEYTSLYFIVPFLFFFFEAISTISFFICFFFVVVVVNEGIIYGVTEYIFSFSFYCYSLGFLFLLPSHSFDSIAFSFF